jgi:hypothetical protein
MSLRVGIIFICANIFKEKEIKEDKMARTTMNDLLDEISGFFLINQRGRIVGKFVASEEILESGYRKYAEVSVELEFYSIVENKNKCVFTDTKKHIKDGSVDHNDPQFNSYKEDLKKEILAEIGAKLSGECELTETKDKRNGAIDSFTITKNM